MNQDSLYIAPSWFWIILTTFAVFIPLLIHLINLLRYQKVKWAAMEFLLRGIRRKKNQLRLRQFFLISSRVLLLLIAIVFFGQLRFWETSQKTMNPGTTHIVIVDDSYSMNQKQLVFQQKPENMFQRESNPKKQNQQPTCFDFAKQAVLNLARSLSGQPNQKILLLRTSYQRGEFKTAPVDCDSNVEFYVNRFFSAPVSDQSISPFAWLNANLGSLPEGDILYLLTDARIKDFKGELPEQVRMSVDSRIGEFRFINCNHTEMECDNLAITSFVPEHGLISAGVPTYLKIEVTSFSDKSLSNIPIRIKRTTSASSSNKMSFAEEASVLIPKIKKGEKFTAQVPVLLNRVGPVVFEAELPQDSLETDNLIHLAVNVRGVNNVLLVSDPERNAVRYLSWLFEPRLKGSIPVRSGFQAIIKAPSELADMTSSLSDYDVIFWLSDDLSNSKAIEKIYTFVSDGGLLVFNPGPQADLKRINDNFYRQGLGLISFPLDSAVDLPERENIQQMDIKPKANWISSLFAGNSKALLQTVRVYKKFIPPREWNPNQSANTDILAYVRGRQMTPLVVQTKLKRGKTISFLVPWEDGWTNWPINPSFLVLIYRMIYEAIPYGDRDSFSVGDLIPKRKLADIGFSTEVNPFAIRHSPSLEEWDLSSFANLKIRPETRIQSRGIFMIQQEERRFVFAVNPDFTESDLRCVTDDELHRTLQISEDANFKWNEIGDNERTAENRNLFGLWILLMLFYFIEHIFAYKLGFHQAKRKAVKANQGSKQSWGRYE